MPIIKGGRMSTFWHALREGIETIEVIEQQLPLGCDPKQIDSPNDFAGYFIKNGNKTFAWRMHTIPVNEKVRVSFSLVEFHDDQAHSLQIIFDATAGKWSAELCVLAGVDDQDGLMHLFSLISHRNKMSPSILSSEQKSVVSFKAEIHDKNAWKLLDQLLAYYA